jgi:hypothetical protein
MAPLYSYGVSVLCLNFLSSALAEEYAHIRSNDLIVRREARTKKNLKHSEHVLSLSSDKFWPFDSDTCDDNHIGGTYVESVNQAVFHVEQIDCRFEFHGIDVDGQPIKHRGTLSKSDDGVVTVNVDDDNVWLGVTGRVSTTDEKGNIMKVDFVDPNPEFTSIWTRVATEVIQQRTAVPAPVIPAANPMYSPQYAEPQYQNPLQYPPQYPTESVVPLSVVPTSIAPISIDPASTSVAPALTVPQTSVVPLSADPMSVSPASVAPISADPASTSVSADLAVPTTPAPLLDSSMSKKQGAPTSEAVPATPAPSLDSSMSKKQGAPTVEASTSVAPLSMDSTSAVPDETSFAPPATSAPTATLTLAPTPAPSLDAALKPEAAPSEKSEKKSKEESKREEPIIEKMEKDEEKEFKKIIHDEEEVEEHTRRLKELHKKWAEILHNHSASQSQS